jgi:hypothetical protein
MTTPMPAPDPTPVPPQDPTPDTPDTGAPDQKDPAAEAEKWKTLARKHEARAKENASAAERLKQLEDAQKSEQQRLEERAAAAERERDDRTAEALRWRVAAEHSITGDDLELLEGITDESKLRARATRIAEMRAAATAAQTPAARQPTPARPVAQLQPGATPLDHKSDEDVLYESLFGTTTT